MKINFKFYLKSRNNKSGFVLTQVLILAIGLSLTITALISSAVNRLALTKIKKLELDARNASDSSITVLKSLFNNRKNRAFNYYWLQKICSENLNQEYCPIENRKYSGEDSIIKDMSSLYWNNESTNWCINSLENCFGRQIAPKCTAITNFSRGAKSIDWITFNSYISNFLNKEISISDHFGYDQKNNFQSFSLKSIDYYGDDRFGGTTSLLIEGISRKNLNSTIKTASNKLRVNIKVVPEIESSGFAFLSAGENDNDKNSIFLGNLEIIGDTGSILWRRNIKNSFECEKLNQITGISQLSSIPSNGGIWVQPIYSPPNPYINIPRNQIVKFGNLYCLDSLSNSTTCNSNNWGKINELERVFSINNLLIRGENSELNIFTSNTSKVTIIINGSVDINFGGKICHIDKRDFFRRCGSGKSSNLTLILKPEEGGVKSQQKLQCSRKGGISYVRNKITPNNSFILGNTGNDDSEIFTSFIYAPSSTFITAIPNLDYYQDSSNKNQIFIYRGTYSYLENISNIVEPIFFKDPEGNLLNFMSNYEDISKMDFFSNLYLVGVGQRSLENQPTSNTMLNMALVKKNNEYFLLGFIIENESAKFVKENTNGRVWRIFLGNNPFSVDNNGKSWISYYGIDLKKTNQFHSNINVEGALWAKNICFDKKIVNWEFKKEFINNLINRYGQEFNYGVPYYRGTSIEVWDTMRDFSN